MTKSLISFGFIVITTLGAYAQEFSESVQPLSTKAVKGYMYEAIKDSDGNSLITYKIPGSKKSNEVFFEEYSFDKNLTFINSKDVQEKKTQKDDFESTVYSAYVGGSTSFDVTSMKLKLSKVVATNTWNYEKQRFVVKKIISRETIKPKNDNGKVYLGYASYNSADYKKSDVFTLAKVESKGKNADDKFYVLLFNDKLEITEKPIDLNGSYTLVFCDQVAGEDVVMVFAPNKGAADLMKYVYFEFDISGNLKNRVEFKSPASALLLTVAYKKDGDIYFCGSSTKSTEPYEKVFNEYAPIFNPGITDGGANLADIKWQKSSQEKMDNFHLLKFTGNQLTFASTTPVTDFKEKFKTAPGDKGASPYKGSKFFIEQFTVTPSGDYLIAGQLTGTAKLGDGVTAKSYEDIVCFHFDKAGNLRAQYGLGKINTDKKSEIFSMSQKFYLSSDGKQLLWEILEVKGKKGYADFLDALAGYTTFYSLYFPRIGTINLESSSLSAFKEMGDGKYYLRKDFTSVYDKNEKSITYIGHDEDFKKLWIGKVMIQ
jgi:hypothetical protein